MPTEPTYRDLDLSFRKHPLTGDVSTFTDEAAVKAALRNLVQLARFDKPFNPEISSPVVNALFEQADPITASIFKIDIEDLISRYETRIRSFRVGVKAEPDANRYVVDISFVLKKIPNIQTLELFIPVERLR
jgi:phage baseplate assembly protein W